jgi:hypothetical protein
MFLAYTQGSSAGTVTRLQAEWAGDRITIEAKVFLFPQIIQTGSGAHRGSFKGLKRKGCEVNHLFQISAIIKIKWSCASSPQFAFMALPFLHRWIFIHLQSRWAQRHVTCSLLLNDFNQTWASWQTFLVALLNVNFYDNPFSGCFMRRTNKRDVLVTMLIRCILQSIELHE